MKKLSLLLLLITPLIMTTSLHAVTYPFPENGPAYLKDGSVVKTGTKLYLYHNGTEEVNNTINVDDTLTVYREGPPDFSLTSKDAGKVRMLIPLGDYYFEGEVVEGAM
jgi:hypothetical protein